MILIGSYIDSVSQADPVSMTRLMKGLDEFLEHDQDRALFDLAPGPKTPDAPSPGVFLGVLPGRKGTAHAASS